MAAGTGQAKTTVLLVDDEPNIRHLRAQILEKQGYQVESASTLAEARAAWKPGKYELIIVDLRNEVKAGLEFCEELKQEYPDQLVAFLTAPWNYVPQNSCPDEVIPKEDGPAEFVRRVDELLA